ncbi:hypothetical protein SAMN05421753_1066 [Planctomicrobium piriforme]|uniref:Uncharacterized protein n=1 Tax=Planctomicrobium piriforme TaxID=1576369 RepID=A0A1I3FSC5_9PLAN|nr:hypothetical protein SAMN05421753_1066 [Planctomicrobium piriforme]
MHADSGYRLACLAANRNWKIRRFRHKKSVRRNRCDERWKTRFRGLRRAKWTQFTIWLVLPTRLAIFSWVNSPAL